MPAYKSKNTKRVAVAMGLMNGLLISCTPSPPGRRLEIRALRYDTSNFTACEGEIKNVSPSAISNLNVQVEFQNAEGNRVRIADTSVIPATVPTGGTARFSAPYQRGSNDPPVLRCRVLEFQSGGIKIAHEDENGLGKER